MKKQFLKYKIMGAAAVMLAGLFAGCGENASSAANGSSFAPQSQSTDYRKLTAEQAQERLKSGDELVLLDVRTALEYAQAHIPGARLLPNEEIDKEPPEQLPDKDAEILIYCRSGNRSAQAAKKLAALGYTNVYDFGGITDWPYETESGEWAG